MIKTTKAVFEILLVLFSEKDVNLSAVAKRIGLSVMGVSKIVKRLEENNLVGTTKVGRSLVVRLNKTGENGELFALAEKYKFEKFVGGHGTLMGFLVELRERVKGRADFALIFGSYAAGEESHQSDLDILIVSPDRKVAKIIKELAVLVDCRIAPVTVKLKDFVEQYRKDHRLYREIVDGKRVLISGEYKFWETLLAMRK
jgi:predicted nucleotidyltransferase